MMLVTQETMHAIARCIGQIGAGTMQEIREHVGEMVHVYVWHTYCPGKDDRCLVHMNSRLIEVRDFCGVVLTVSGYCGNPDNQLQEFVDGYSVIAAIATHDGTVLYQNPLVPFSFFKREEEFQGECNDIDHCDHEQIEQIKALIFSR